VIVKVADLSEVVRQARYRESAGPLNDLLGQVPQGDQHRFESDLEVDSELYRHGTDVYFQGNLSATVRTACRRCLEDFDWQLARAFRFLIVKTARGTEPEDDTGIDHYAGDQIDLSPLVREQALLALDDRGLCSEECKGLCPGCGANLNGEDCKCRHRLDR
jgi:uncharacterized protein